MADAQPHYREPGWFTRNVFNRAVRGLTSAGVSVMGSRVLEVRGRKSGQPQRIPVNLLTLDGSDYLVSARGEGQWVAAKLELQPINVQEVVTFYPMFRQRPIGRRHIKVCRTLSCALLGGYKTCETFEKEFNTHRGEVSPDGEVTIEFVECLASCGTAPVVMIDDALHEKVDAARARQLAQQIKSEAGKTR